jgi:hypothetical protein
LTYKIQKQTLKSGQQWSVCPDKHFQKDFGFCQQITNIAVRFRNWVLVAGYWLLGVNTLKLS